MESADSVQGLLALGESLPKRPRAAEVVFEEEDLGSGEFAVIYERTDQILQENEDIREELAHAVDRREAMQHEIDRLTRIIQAHENRLNKLQHMLECSMRRIVALERPE